MILLDSRAGSRDLYQPLRSLGIGVELTVLEYGDVGFMGKGPDGDLVVGIEYKRLGDMVQCMRDGRFVGHQLIGMAETYQVIYLLIEGTHTPAMDPNNGQIYEYDFGHRYWKPLHARVDYKELDSHLNSLRMCAGVHVIRSVNLWESANMVADLHRWWQKDWADHKSHTGMMHKAYLPSTPGTVGLPVKASLVRRWAKELSSIGAEKSLAVERAFPGVDEMVNATEEEWTKIEGIGPKTAQKIIAELRRKYHN